MKLTSASAKETFDKQSLSQLEGLIHQEIQKTVEVELRDSKESLLESISRLMNELLDICCDASNPDGWAKSKIVETQLRKLGVPTKDVQERKMALFSARLGLDYGGVNGISENTRRLSEKSSSSQEWLIPNLFPLGMPSLIYGDSGSGKTTIVLHIANAYIEGIPFADSIYPAKNDNRKVLFVASDGQGDAFDHIYDFAEQSGFLSEDSRFDDHIEIYAASDDGSSGPFNFSEPHLLSLFNKIAGGKFGLVIIDSLKASCMGTNYTIDDRGITLPMRLVHAMCARTKTTLIWLHHTNKSNSDSSHRAGGSTDVIEVVASAHELRYFCNENTGQGRGEWLVQKLRGGSKRKFGYTFEFETGLVLDSWSDETLKTGDRILVAIYSSPNKRLKREDVARLLGLQPNTLSNHASYLRGEKFLKSGKVWELTGKGTQRAKELLQSEQPVGVIASLGPTSIRGN